MKMREKKLGQSAGSIFDLKKAFEKDTAEKPDNVKTISVKMTFDRTAGDILKDLKKNMRVYSMGGLGHRLSLTGQGASIKSGSMRSSEMQRRIQGSNSLMSMKGAAA